MHTTNRMYPFVALVSFAALSPAQPAAAQLANASAATLGVGGNATAIAREFGAISVNPAGLGMPGSGFSLALGPVAVRQGLGPVTLGNILDFEGALIPVATKEDWISRVTAQGGQTGSVGAEVSELAFTAGRVGFQLSTLVGLKMTLAPDIVESMLYGNAGRTGEPADLSLAGSAIDGFAVTTAGLSLGLPLPSETGSMAVGLTVKYSVGHAVLVGRDQGGSVQSDPVKVEVNFPLVTFDEDGKNFNNGSGVGVDVGFQMKRDRVSFGAAVLNAFNTFAWKAENLVYRPGTAIMELGNTHTDFDKQAASSAPGSVTQALDELKFDPTLSVGAAYDMNADFTISADVRNRFGDGMSIAPKLHAGVGAEYRGLKILHLRAGAAAITDGIQFGGGASLVLGPVNLSFAGAVQQGDVGDTNIGQFSLSFGGR